MASYLDPSGYKPDSQELIMSARRWLIAFGIVLLVLVGYLAFQKWRLNYEADRRGRTSIAQDYIAEGMGLNKVVQLLGQPTTVLTPPLPIERQPNNDKEYGHAKVIDDGSVAECAIYRVPGLPDFAVYYNSEQKVICTRHSKSLDLSITGLW